MHIGAIPVGGVGEGVVVVETVEEEFGCEFERHPFFHNIICSKFTKFFEDVIIIPQMADVETMSVRSAVSSSATVPYAHFDTLDKWFGKQLIPIGSHSLHIT